MKTVNWGRGTRKIRVVEVDVKLPPYYILFPFLATFFLSLFSLNILSVPVCVASP